MIVYFRVKTMRRETQQRGVSPIIGVLLLLGLTVSLLALASTIIFDSVDETESPKTDIEITHTFQGNNADVMIRVLRNENINEYSYYIEDENGQQKGSRETFSNQPGTTETVSNVQPGETVVIIGEVGSEYVLETYNVPS